MSLRNITLFSQMLVPTRLLRDAVKATFPPLILQLSGTLHRNAYCNVWLQYQPGLQLRRKETCKLSVADTVEDGVALSFYLRYGDVGYEQVAEPKQRFSLVDFKEGDRGGRHEAH